jgi:tyrosinase
VGDATNVSKPPPSTPRVRRDVQSLLSEGKAGRQVLDDYAEAIKAMRKRDPGPADPTDPLSWRFQAAIHGFPGLEASINHPQGWGSCRHNSWFFLPWHRVYLYFFERIVQFHLEDETWSLPYWDYTKTHDDSSRILPEPFRTPTSGNELFVKQRDSHVNRQTDPIGLSFASTDARPALSDPDFTIEGADPKGSFAGGKVKDVLPTMNARGAVELTPHGLVHGLVGGQNPPGLMSRFDTAALDPVFWLHHCNMDRLWDVWIQIWGAELLPDDSAWLETKFEFFDRDGTKKRKAIGDILESANLGYVYESTDPPGDMPEPARLRELLAGLGEEARVDMAEPELVGAASAIEFARRSVVGIDLASPRSRALGPDATPQRWFLRVEDVTGEQPAAPAYDIYLNLPESDRASDHPELRVGSIASFGIPEATQRESAHGGIGVTDVFEITGVISALRESERWDETSVAVTIVPADVTGEVEEGGDVRAGRISIYAR